MWHLKYLLKNVICRSPGCNQIFYAVLTFLPRSNIDIHPRLSPRISLVGAASLCIYIIFNNWDILNILQYWTSTEEIEPFVLKAIVNETLLCGRCFINYNERSVFNQWNLIELEARQIINNSYQTILILHTNWLLLFNISHNLWSICYVKSIFYIEYCFEILISNWWHLSDIINT